MIAVKKQLLSLWIAADPAVAPVSVVTGGWSRVFDGNICLKIGSLTWSNACRRAFKSYSSYDESGMASLESS